MFNKKSAFALTEVLIALAIIGVITALTLPQLAKDTDKKIFSAELARAVELFEGGMTNIMRQAERNNDTAPDKLSDIKTSDIFGNISDDSAVGSGSEDEDDEEETGTTTDSYLTDGQTLYAQMKGLINIIEVSNAYLTKVKTYSGDAISTVYANFSNNKVYKFTKHSSAIIAEDIDDSKVKTLDAEGNETGTVDANKVIARIFFDVNGSKGPNRLAKDIFQFGLTNGGQLVPAGSQAYNDNVFSETVPLFTAACNNSVTDGRSCSARVMSDRWQIKY